MKLKKKLTEESNENNNNNNSNTNLPPSFDLHLFQDDDTDEFLMEYLRKNPVETSAINANNNTALTNNTNNMPIVPKMLFQNSNVTINYNFSK